MGNNLPGTVKSHYEKSLRLVRPEQKKPHARPDIPHPGSPPAGSDGREQSGRLGELEADFNRSAGKGGVLNAADLANVWKSFAERQVGELGEKDTRLIEGSAKVYHRLLDVAKTGYVSYPEFVTFMLGGMEERAQMKNMRGKLQAMLKSRPETLKRLVTKFRQWDTNGDGYVTEDDIKTSLGDDRAQQRAPREIQAFLSEVLRKAHYSSDDKIELWELIAFSLGLRKMPVELILYDISSGASRRASPLLLGHSFEAIYHTGIMAFGREYWYGGRIFNNDPPAHVFGSPLQESGEVELRPSFYRPELQVVHLGYTFVSPREFHRFLADDLALKYTPDSYEVLTHNCNSFCEEAARYLTGAGIPRQILELPQRLMASPVAQFLEGAGALRPLLNRWLGGFDAEASKAGCAVAGEGGEGPADPAAGPGEDGEPEEAAAAGPAAALARGTVVSVAGLGIDGTTAGRPGARLVGSVVADGGDTVHLRCFDPLRGRFFDRHAVPRAAIGEALSSPPPAGSTPTPSALPRPSGNKEGEFVTI